MTTKAATVPICDVCWLIEEPGRSPIRMKDRPPDPCYRCQKPTLSGIYVRRMIEQKDPDNG